MRPQYTCDRIVEMIVFGQPPYRYRALFIGCTQQYPKHDQLVTHSALRTVQSFPMASAFSCSAAKAAFRATKYSSRFVLASRGRFGRRSLIVHRGGLVETAAALSSRQHTFPRKHSRIFATPRNAGLESMACRTLNMVRVLYSRWWYQ